MKNIQHTCNSILYIHTITITITINKILGNTNVPYHKYKLIKCFNQNRKSVLVELKNVRLLIIRGKACGNKTTVICITTVILRGVVPVDDPCTYRESKVTPHWRLPGVGWQASSYQRGTSPPETWKKKWEKKEEKMIMNISINPVPSISNEIIHVGAYGFSSTRCFEPSFFKKVARLPSPWNF